VGSIAEELVAQFDTMVRRDGGSVGLVSEGPDRIEVWYQPGQAAPDCADGVCVLPQEELRVLMAETLGRRSPGTDLIVTVRP
jgi:hypothetical protein